jgi:dTDP-4-dehydrorhamnose reductase
MQKILITGSQGQVAYELIQLLQEQNREFLALSRNELDITQPSRVNEMIQQYKPNVVINAAAYTQVDRAEQERELAYAVNYEGPKNLAMACTQAKCALVHISTDYVFDGNETTPYLETHPITPINIYGASKREGEVAVQDQCEQAIILRVSGVFGVHGNNFVKTMLRLAKEREILRVVADQMICPTPAKDIAKTILCMLSNPRWGLYHYCGNKPTHWHALAQLIVQKALTTQQSLLVKTIEAISSADYPTAAKRPRYSVLNCEKIYATYGIKQPDWEQGLTDVITQLSAS